jgi:hypothetical protein
VPASNEIYFVYFVDCEPLRERSPMCGGPASWEVSEETVRGIRETFEARGLRDALTFNLTPEAARAHGPMMRHWHEEGVPLGIQPNVPGFRYPTYDRDLGQYDEDTQRRIIAEASADFEDAVGFRPRGYCACCGSKSPATLDAAAALRGRLPPVHQPGARPLLPRPARSDQRGRLPVSALGERPAPSASRPVADLRHRLQR